MKERDNLIKQKYRDFLNSQIVDSIQEKMVTEEIPIQKRIIKKRLYEDLKKRFAANTNNSNNYLDSINF